MKSRGEGGRTTSGIDGRARDGITALLGMAVVVVAAFGACSLDDKNPPLPNEAPNRGQFVGGIAIGAGPGGTGGSGAGLGSGGSTLSSTGGGGPIPPNCDCAVAYSDPSMGCSACFNTAVACQNDLTACNADPNCSDLLQGLANCLGDPSCVKIALDAGNGDAAFEQVISCGCLNCSSECGGGSC